jgi:hypothetical protein
MINETYSYYYYKFVCACSAFFVNTLVRRQYDIDTLAFLNNELTTNIPHVFQHDLYHDVRASPQNSNIAFRAPGFPTPRNLT